MFIMMTHTTWLLVMFNIAVACLNISFFLVFDAVKEVQDEP